MRKKGETKNTVQKKKKKKPSTISRDFQSSMIHAFYSLSSPNEDIFYGVCTYIFHNVYCTLL